jgi:hypothetical protein
VKIVPSKSVGEQLPPSAALFSCNEWNQDLLAEASGSRAESLGMLQEPSSVLNRELSMRN